jgi:Ser/Thr protein kinase RdoA (MazF antagonist)
MTDPSEVLLTICRRLVDPEAQPVALHAGHNDTAVLRASTTAGQVVVKCHRSLDRHRQEVHAYQHWTAALGGKTPRLIAINDDPPGIVATAMPGRPLAEANLERQQELQAHRQAGGILSLLHNAAPPRFEPDMTAWLSERGEHWLTLARDLLSAQRRADIRAHLRALAALGPLPAVPCHLDFTPRNLLCSTASEPAQVNDLGVATPPAPLDVSIAVIDFEHARFDLAARDLVRFATRTWPKRPDLEQAFIEAYGAVTELDREVVEHASYLDALTMEVGTARRRNSLRVAPEQRKTF